MHVIVLSQVLCLSWHKYCRPCRFDKPLAGVKTNNYLSKISPYMENASSRLLAPFTVFLY